MVWLLACASACKSEKPAAKTDPWAGKTPETAAPASGDKKWYAGDAPVGVWTGLEPRMAASSMSDGTISYLSTDLVLANYVVWPDGHMSQNAPWNGLADFDRSAWESTIETDGSQGGRPGTYVKDGDGWLITYKNGAQMQMSIVGNELQIGKTKLRRASDVSGATLDGTYTPFTDPNDPLLSGPGCQRLVTFTADGKFINRGGFARTCPAAESDPGRPGSGTYEIRDFSIVLKYDDGRNIKRLILARQNLDLHADNARALIMGELWSRRTAPISDGPVTNAATTNTPPASQPTTAPVVAGDTTTFDAIAFKTPPGTVQQNKGSLQYTAGDGDEFCMMVVFAGVPGTGKPDRDFAAEWKDVMLNGRTVDTAPAPQQGQTPNGLVFNVAGSMTTEASNNARTFRALLVLEVGNRRLSVMLIAPQEAQLEKCKLDDFLGSVRGA
ncbi:MAG TPA: hypothetical protein VGM90_37950 [Kofleriaceae bacterium]